MTGDPVNVYSHGAVGDGVTDDRAAIMSALATGNTVFFPRGTYRVSKYILVQGVTGQRIRGESGATILYPSDNSSLNGDGVALLPSSHRSGIYVLNSNGVIVEGLRFQGGTSNDINVNIGPSVYSRNSEDFHMRDCHLYLGAGLFNQDPAPADKGARIVDCSSYATHNVLTLGFDSEVRGCRFELPDTTDYDRYDASHASSHAIYVFAERNNVIISGCTFKNIRTIGIKFSASSAPVRRAVVTGNIFDDCGCGVFFGSANAEFTEFAGCDITGNIFNNCTTNRLGWTHNAAIQIAGSRGVVISDNYFDYNRPNLFTLGGCYAILATPGGVPLEDLVVSNNLFTATDDGFNVLQASIEVRDVGQNNAAFGNVTVEGNTFGKGGGYGVNLLRCYGLALRGNIFRGPIVAVGMDSNPGAVADGNVLVMTPTTSGDAQFRVIGTPAPLIYNQVGPWIYSGI